MEQRKKTHNNKSLLRVAQTAVACAAFALLAACGGGGGGSSSSSSTPAGGVALQAVSFGDSLSDVGTYAGYVTLRFGGGRFTTNPGQTWTQDVAAYYGDTLTPAVSSGFGQTPQNLGGRGFAQGGARVSVAQGISYPTLSTVPVTTQVQTYLAEYGSFNSNQLVMIQGGPNDILIAAQVMAANATNPAVINQQITNVTTAAVTLAQTVGTLLQNGATKVVVANVPDIGKTPLGVASADGGATLTQLSAGFNTALTAALTQGGIINKVIFVDSFSFIDNVIANPGGNGFQVANTGTACNLQQMVASATAFGQQNPSQLNGQTPAQFGQALGSSLFCSPQTLTTAGADQTYMFADQVHPTTKLHQLFAQYVEQQIAKAGIGH